MNLINIVCVLKKGGRVGYDATWVEKLKNSIDRNLTLPYQFICLSDTDVPCNRIPLEKIDTGLKSPGWWAKIQLFQPNLFNGPVLYFDLDTVITGNIDEMVKNVIAQPDFLMEYDTKYKISSSAIMYWNGDYSQIYREYIKDPKYYENKYSAANQDYRRLLGDQALISTTVKHRYINEICPSSWFHIVGKYDANIDLSEVKVLIFRKPKQKPSNMKDHPLVKIHWR